MEGFKGHVATDGSLLGKTGKWRACGRAVVQLDYDEEMGPLYDKGLWNLAGEKILRERETLRKEEGDATRECKAMNEENFLCSWFREDGKEKEERYGGNEQ